MKSTRLTALVLAVVLGILSPLSVLADTAEVFETAEAAESGDICTEAAEVTEIAEAAEAQADVYETSEVSGETGEGLLSAGVAVSMEKAAPAEGKEIKVTKPGTSTLRWFVYAQGADRGNAVSKLDTYTPSKADRNKWIEVQAYDPQGTFVGSDRLFFGNNPVCYLTLAEGSTEVYDLYIGNQYNNTAEIEEIKDNRTGGSGVPKVYRVELSSAAALFGMNASSYYVLIPTAVYETLPPLLVQVPGGRASADGYR